MSKKKILFIHHAVGWGGAPKSMIELIKSLDKSEYKPYVLLLKKSIVADQLEENNIDFSIAESMFYKRYYHYFTHSEAGYIKWYQAYRFIKLSILWLLSRYYFANKELKKHKFDLVHLNSSVLTDWLAPSSKLGKVIIHIREPFRKGNVDILHYFFRLQMKKYTDKIIAISKDNAVRINLQDKTDIVYNSTNIRKSEPAKESYSSKKFIYLGGDASIKGFYTLIKALDFLDNGIKIYFGGIYNSDNSYSKSLKGFIMRIVKTGKNRKKAIQKMRSHPNAVEIGLIHNVNKYLEDVCCLISPFSVSHFSRPVIEANLHKKPAIGSDVDGMDEIIKNKVTGLLFPVDNANLLAKEINYLANNPQIAEVYGRNAYKIAKEKYTSKNIELVINIYDSILSDLK